MRPTYSINAALKGTGTMTTRTNKREAIRELHRMMREYGEGARGDVYREGFGYVVQQRLTRNKASSRLTFVNEEL